MYYIINIQNIKILYLNIEYIILFKNYQVNSENEQFHRYYTSKLFDFIISDDSNKFYEYYNPNNILHYHYDHNHFEKSIAKSSTKIEFTNIFKLNNIAKLTETQNQELNKLFVNSQGAFVFDDKNKISKEEIFAKAFKINIDQVTD